MRCRDGSLLTMATLALLCASCGGVENEAQTLPADQVEQVDGGSSEPCAGAQGAPIRVSAAVAALRSHGFGVRKDAQGCTRNVVASLTNVPKDAPDAGDVLEREGVVACFVFAKPPQNAPREFVRRGVDGGDAELLLENLNCTILADSPRAEEKIDPLEKTFDELQRAIRP